MEGFARIHDAELDLHNEPAAIVVSQDGSIAGTPKVHETGPGMLAPGSYLFINVETSDDADGSETYHVNFLAQSEGGSFENFGRFGIPRGTTEQVFIAPVTNRWFDGKAYDTFKVNIELGGMTPSIKVRVRMSVVGI